MLNVDISNIWCSVSLPTLLESEEEIANAHSALTDAPGADFLAWLDGDLQPEAAQIAEAAGRIGEMAQVLVVVGNDSAVLGARAVLELLRGRRHNLRSGLQVLFTGSDFSTQAWHGLSELLEGRDFCVQVVGRHGDGLPEAVATRAVRWLLERRYGTEKARERVFVATDSTRGPLREIAAAEGYAAFPLPRTLAGHASALAPAALLAPAAAGVDVGRVLAGAAAARPLLELRTFDNPAWLYAAGRTILARRGKRAEYFCPQEPDAEALARWWQQLFGGRAVLAGDGLLPAVARLPADWQQMAALFADGANPLMATFLRFQPPAQKVPVEMDWKNFDNLNCLEGYTLDYLQDQALLGAIQAAADGGVPSLVMDCAPLAEETAGELLYFFELTSCLCAGMLGRDVYEAEAPAAWAAHMDRQLGRNAD